MRTIAIAALVSLPMWAAQDLPDGSTLMKQSAAAARQFRSIEYTVDTIVETGPNLKVTTESLHAVVPPDKSRRESKTKGATSVVVSDGNTTWVYSSAVNQYSKVPAALGVSGVFAAMGMANLVPDFAKASTTEKTRGSETIDIDGRKHDCWVVDTHIGELAFPGKAGAKMTGGDMTVWIDKKLGLDLKNHGVVRMTMGNGQPSEVRVSMIKRKLKVNEPLPDSLFTFTPPPGAKFVEKLPFGLVQKADLVGKDAPDFAVKTLDAKPYSLAALKGKPVLLDFWATWCSPCRRSVPVLENLQKELGDSATILAVNSGEAKTAVANFLKSHPMAYPTALSGDSGILEKYGVGAYPTFILIDADGKVLVQEVGFPGEGALRDALANAGLKLKK